MKRVKRGEQPLGTRRRVRKVIFISIVERIHVCKQFGRNWRKIGGNSLIESRGQCLLVEGGRPNTAIDLPLTRGRRCARDLAFHRAAALMRCISSLAEAFRNLAIFQFRGITHVQETCVDRLAILISWQMYIESMDGRCRDRLIERHDQIVSNVACITNICTLQMLLLLLSKRTVITAILSFPLSLSLLHASTLVSISIND